MPDAGEVVWLQFPGVIATKRRPAVVLSSAEYHRVRPDVIVGLITSQISKSNATTDHVLADWASSGLRVPSAFRAFITTLPRSGVALHGPQRRWSVMGKTNS
jgi:mRNA interferase MazF